MSFNTISVIGLGYIGLPTAAIFAANKKHVIGVDRSQHVVDTINQAQIHIIEPDLDGIVHRAVTEGYLKATTEAQPADAFLIAVPTPFTDDRQPDLSYIKAASKSIAPVLKKGDLVILESTSPVGATEQLSQWLSEFRPDLTFPQKSTDTPDVNVAHCPERVLPGHVIRELVENDRVIGGITPICSERAIELYKIFVTGKCISTNARTAEMAKLTENASRDVSIAFANELSVICDELDINVWELIKLANRHPRVNILQPGPGVGGHCIAVDPWFIVAKSPDSAKLIQQARQVNDAKPEWVLGKAHQIVQKYLMEHVKKSVSDITIAVYGLAFKPNIDDLRESPALDIARKIQEEYANSTLVAIEPNIESLPDILSDFTLVDFDTACSTADIHLVLVDHREFVDRRTELPRDYLVDTRGLVE